MSPPVPDDPEQPPGARHFVRILAETLQAHDATLSAGDDVVARLTPRHWAGPASETFVDTAVRAVDTEWGKVAEVNREAVKRVDGYNNFVHTLRDLWPDSDPSERQRLQLLWHQETSKVADDLLARAAELDRCGHIKFTELDATPEPDRFAGPALRQVEPSHPRPEGEAPLAHLLAPSSGWPQLSAMVLRHTMAARLREQLLEGTRREHIPWPG